ncbi:MAG: hypothetical protein NTV04_21035, partial [Deltaproteobacteria bacterium]|nr:hypothetical protein [Deltaproteobacteria bacterium]
IPFVLSLSKHERHTEYDFLRIHQFCGLKKWGNSFRFGPGVRVERAGSIGWISPWPRGPQAVSAGGGGASLHRPTFGEISAL